MLDMLPSQTKYVMSRYEENDAEDLCGFVLLNRKMNRWVERKQGRLEAWSGVGMGME